MIDTSTRVVSRKSELRLFTRAIPEYLAAMRRIAMAVGVASMVLAGSTHAGASEAASRVTAHVAIDSRASQPPNGWVRREVPNWIYWVPNGKWVASHTKNGIDVSSPTGDIVVSSGWSSSPIAVTIPEVVAYLFSPANTSNFVSLRITKKGKITGRPGDQKQTVAWAGVRRHPTKGNQAVKGSVQVHVFTVGYGAYGFTTEGMMAPTRQWNASLPTMRIILGNIRYLPS